MVVNACYLSSSGVWCSIGACEFGTSLGFKLPCVNVVIVRLSSCLHKNRGKKSKKQKYCMTQLYPKVYIYHRNAYTSMFLAALFTIVKL